MSFIFQLSVLKYYRHLKQKVLYILLSYNQNNEMSLPILKKTKFFFIFYNFFFDFFSVPVNKELLTANVNRKANWIFYVSIVKIEPWPKIKNAKFGRRRYTLLLVIEHLHWCSKRKLNLVRTHKITAKLFSCYVFAVKKFLNTEFWKLLFPFLKFLRSIFCAPRKVDIVGLRTIDSVVLMLLIHF